MTHPLRCETCERPYCDGETTRFKYCPIADHFVLMLWEDKYVPYTQTSQDFLKVGCASHSDVRKERERVLDELKAFCKEKGTNWAYDKWTMENFKTGRTPAGRQGWGVRDDQTKRQLRTKETGLVELSGM